MGEVYRARDTRLGREVAVKVLPEAVAAGTGQRRRFEQEAQVLASLNHPNIAALYGVEESSGTLALVMELVPGDTLADRIRRGPLVLDDAIQIAGHIAEALEGAHERGIIHRDLKPANIKVLPDGNVKVLDFGLAKALEVERTPASNVVSPTLTAAATRAGMILGTAAYMSPEQAKGKTVDQRSDLWSFGCVLYELVTGKLAFPGETVTDTLAAVVRGEPDWTALPAEMPASVRHLLQRCLRKDPKQRLQSAGDARITLEEARLGDAVAVPQVSPGVAPRTRGIGRGIPWAAAALLAILAIWLWHPWRTAPRGDVVRVAAELGIEGSLHTTYGSSVVLSPDGSRVVYVVEDASHSRALWLRSFDQLEARRLLGTDGARDSFFSPDGQWIGFFAASQMKKISVDGGAIVTLCSIQDDRGAAWGEDGSIIFAAATRAPLMRIPDGGGSPTPFSKLSGNSVTHRWPQFLPGSKVVIYTSSDDGNNYENADIIAQVVATGERKTLYHGGYAPRYLPGDYLVFVHQGTVFGMRFDARSLAVTSQPVPLIGGIVSAFGNAGSQVSFSNTGRAAYVSGSSASTELFDVAWLSAGGQPEPLMKEPRTYWALTFSPDGNLLALSIEERGSQDVFVSDWKRNVVTRLTFGSSTNVFPAWTSDGKRISYVVDETGGRFSISWKPATGAGDKHVLLESDRRFGPMTWHPDGKVLVFAQLSPQGNSHLVSATLQGDDKSGWKLAGQQQLTDGDAQETEPAFSPDGKWLAYQSTETGSSEIFVRPFPGPGGRWQVSHGDGFFPAWSRTSKELFFGNSSNQLMAAPYSTSGDSFSPGTPRLWNPMALGDRGVQNVNYALHPDGKRVAVLEEYYAGKRQPPRLTYVFNFLAEVQQKLETSTSR